MRVLIGTYPAVVPEGQTPEPEGIWQANFDVDSAQFTDLTQVCQVESPSFLALSPDRESLFAVSESTEGRLHRYAVTPDGLSHQHTVDTFGEHPCHVAVAIDQVIVANYGSGSVTSYRKQDGSTELMDPKQFQQSGQGPVTERQSGPHAHFVGQVPSSQHVWVADLGADRICGYQIAASSSGVRHLVARGTAVELPAGSGPRHIVFDGAGYGFVNGELDNNLFTIKVDASTGQGTVVGEISLDIPGEQDQYPSHLELSPDGSALMVAVRGSDTLHLFDVVREPGKDVELVKRAVAPTGGNWPRHFKSFGLRSDGLHIIAVANQNSQTLDVMGINPETGASEHLSSTLLASPACIVAL